jgi:lysozyme
MTKRPRTPPRGTQGIDVFSGQAPIDWKTVAKTKRFAFIKATEGAHFIDAKFQEHWKGAKDAGVIRGPYHFFRPKSPVADQVTNFVDTVGSLEPGDLPPVLDLEVPKDWKGIEQSKRIGLVTAWLEGVEAALKVRPIIYLSPSFVPDILGTDFAQVLGKYKLWIAHYVDGDSPGDIPSPWTEYLFWQYSETGTVDGVSGKDCDLDVYNGTLASLRRRTIKKRRTKVSSKKSHGKKGKA